MSGIYLAKTVENALCNVIKALDGRHSAVEQLEFKLKPQKKKVNLGKFILAMVNSLDLKECHMAIGLIYMDLYILKFPITSKNVFYLFYVAVVLGMKFYDDEVYEDEDLAGLVDLQVEEFSQMQRIFLESVDYRLVVDEQDYEEYLESLL